MVFFWYLSWNNWQIQITRLSWVGQSTTDCETDRFVLIKEYKTEGWYHLLGFITTQQSQPHTGPDIGIFPGVCTRPGFYIRDVGSTADFADAQMRKGSGKRQLVATPSLVLREREASPLTVQTPRNCGCGWRWMKAVENIHGATRTSNATFFLFIFQFYDIQILLRFMCGKLSMRILLEMIRRFLLWEDSHLVLFFIFFLNFFI